ncbi:hypothetical protein [Pedobacter heparinus]|uniref:hypothetical protein n=1 Tax=Pedobacter heparinus TaxID=984 RepID=UPI00292ED5C3|nr:hypothetical protein [Pedobacter heparinus]
MKNLLKISVFAVLLFSSAISFAIGRGFSIKVNGVDQKSISFFMEGPQVVDVSFYGSDDELLYEHTLRSLGSATKIFNLSAFPDGNFTFKLADEWSTAIYNLRIEEGKALISEPVIVDKFKPVLTKENEFVMLNLENAPEGPLEIEIFNKYNEAIYAKAFNASANGTARFTKKFNVSQVYTDELTFVIKSKDQEFKEVVRMY